MDDQDVKGPLQPGNNGSLGGKVDRFNCGLDMRSGV